MPTHTILPLLVLTFFLPVSLLPAQAAVETSALVEAGFPALDREWSGADYVQVAEVLRSGRVPLPHLSETTGQTFLRRFTSSENFALFTDHKIFVGQRLVNFSKLLDGLRSVMSQYLASANRGENVHSETAQLLAFMLRITTQGVSLTDEAMSIIPKDDKYAARMDAVKNMRSGLTTVFVGVEISLGETNFYTADDLSQLLDAMAETLPIAERMFTPDYKTELRKKLEARRPAFPRPEDACRLQGMISQLRS